MLDFSFHTRLLSGWFPVHDSLFMKGEAGFSKVLSSDRKPTNQVDADRRAPIALHDADAISLVHFKEPAT